MGIEHPVTASDAPPTASVPLRLVLAHAASISEPVERPHLPRVARLTAENRSSVAGLPCQDGRMATIDKPDEDPTLEELTDIVSVALAHDNDVDRAVLAVLQRNPLAIPAIKALCASTGMGLADAKAIVDRNLPQHIQESNQRLRSAARDAMQQPHPEPASTGS